VEPRNPDSIARRVAGNAGSTGFDPTDHLVAGDDRFARRSEITFDHV
jgi:hypothetical protein